MQGICRAGIAALLQAVAEHEERTFKLLPAQVISQQVGTAAIRPGAADEGQQEHAVVQFIPIALARDNRSTSLLVCGSNAALRSWSSR